METSIYLKPGKEKAILNRHPWIFSGALLKKPSNLKGEILPVLSSNGEQLASAYFNSHSSIIGRIIAFGAEDPMDSIKKSLHRAYHLRKALIGPDTTCYRLINGEGDFLPGLVVDLYGKHLVIQISTLGMDFLKPFIQKELIKLLNPESIYEKSNLPSRKEEGLRPFEGQILGKTPKEISVLENGLKFIVDICQGQKTGFFLDQRNLRQLVKLLSNKRSVLNAFSYTGGFSVYALSGGANFVDSVDISQDAIDNAKKNVSLNGFSNASFYKEDIFDFLRTNPLAYDLIILDPPAFAKKSKDVVQACRGYKDINRIAMSKMKEGSLLITSSCSHFVDEKLFQQVLFQAALDAKKEVQILHKHTQAFDHPVSIFHPEGSYLKSFVLQIL